MDTSKGPVGVSLILVSLCNAYVGALSEHLATTISSKYFLLRSFFVLSSCTSSVLKHKNNFYQETTSIMSF